MAQLTETRSLPFRLVPLTNPEDFGDCLAASPTELARAGRQVLASMQVTSTPVRLEVLYLGCVLSRREERWEVVGETDSDPVACLERNAAEWFTLALTRSGVRGRRAYHRRTRQLGG